MAKVKQYALPDRPLPTAAAPAPEGSEPISWQFYFMVSMLGLSLVYFIVAPFLI